MNIVSKILAAIIAGFLFAFLGYMVVAFTISDGSNSDAIGWLFMVLWVIAIAIVWVAPTSGKAWRRLLISCGLFSLAMPIASLFLGGRGVMEAANSGGEYAAAATSGAIIGSGMVTMFTGFISLFLAAIFLVIGFSVGRDQPTSKASSDN
ncbi:MULTISPECIES: hypothetical protein [unclassified Halomonas]|uniref:hypothetical protein n=1 Tax=unclassified Halomonas TaxID=2609666 RepID=UPI003CF08D1F